MRDFAFQWLLSYRGLFVFGILIIELPLYLHRQRRPHFARNLALGLLLYFPIGLFFPFPTDSSFLISSCIFSLSVLLIWALYVLPLRATLYLCVMAYLIQNMALNTFKILFAALRLTYEQSPPLHLACMVAFSLLGRYLLIHRWGMDHLADNLDGSRYLVLLGAITSLCLIILIGLLFRTHGMEYNVFACFAVVITNGFALCLQYASLRGGQLEMENKVIQQLLEAERRRYSMSRESIDIINVKCHDLKHQIAAVRAVSQADQQSALEEIEDAVSLYDAVAKTGNETLDSVLTEKSLYCEKHGIVLTYMVDAAELSFFNEMDLYALLANALDNAIESVMKEAREERSIFLRVCRKNDLLSIHVENRCGTPPAFRDGMPQTTKEDRNSHGFGVRSIRYLAERYHGHASFQAAHDMFLLDIVIPIPERQRGSGR